MTRPGSIANLSGKGETGDIVPPRIEYFDNGRMNIRTIPDRTSAQEEVEKKP